MNVAENIKIDNLDIFRYNLFVNLRICCQIPHRGHNLVSFYQVRTKGRGI